MTVTFRPLRYGHSIDAITLKGRIKTGEATQAEADQYIFDLVAGWDFADIETGEPIPVDQPRLLSVGQYNELIAEFNSQMKGQNTVPKTNASKPSSGPTRSKKKGRSYQSRPNGLT